MRLAPLLLLGVSTLPTAAGLAAAIAIGADAESLLRVLDTPGIGRSLAVTLWTGIVATALSLLLAHLAVAVAVTGGWRSWLTAATLPLLAVPHLAMGIGIALVLAPSGLLLRLVSPGLTGMTLPPDWLTVQDPFGVSLIVGLVIKETGFLVLVLFAALAQVPAERLLLQARTLGYGRLKGWLVGVAPLLQAQIRLPLAAVLVFGLSNVEMAIPIGPDLPPTFPVLLWRWFIDPDPGIHAQAYAGTLLLLCINAIVLILAALGSRVVAGIWLRIAQSGSRRVRERCVRGSLIVSLGGLWLLGVLALVALLLRSAAGPWRFPQLLPAAGAGNAWQSVVSGFADVAGTTFGLAAATALLGVALVLAAAEASLASARWRRCLGTWLFLPLLLPQMTFLFGIQVLLAHAKLDGAFTAVAWCHLVFALPYLWGLLAPARAALDPRYASVARTLGAGPVRTWLTVTAPLLLRPTLIGLALAFAISIAQYLPTLFAGGGRIATAATEAAAAAGSGSLRLAAVHAILLAMAPLLAFAAAFGVGAALHRGRRGVAR